MFDAGIISKHVVEDCQEPKDSRYAPTSCKVESLIRGWAESEASPPATTKAEAQYHEPIVLMCLFATLLTPDSSFQ